MDKPCYLFTITYYYPNQGSTKNTHRGLCQTLQNQMGESGRGTHESWETPVVADIPGNSSCIQHWLTLAQHVVSQHEIWSSSNCCSSSFYFSLQALYHGKNGSRKTYIYTHIYTYIHIPIYKFIHTQKLKYLFFLTVSDSVPQSKKKNPNINIDIESLLCWRDRNVYWERGEHVWKWYCCWKFPVLALGYIMQKLCYSLF